MQSAPCRLLLHRQQLLLKIKGTALCQGKKARCEHGLWLKVFDLPKYGERKNSMILGGFRCIQSREGAIRES